MSIDNKLVNEHYGVGSMEFLEAGRCQVGRDSEGEQVLLMSMAGRQPQVAVEDAAKITFLPDVFGSHEKYKKSVQRVARSRT